MFNLRRCCIGAALGLSLLACQPARAVPFPVTNPHFQPTTPGGAITGWNPTGVGPSGQWTFSAGQARMTNGDRDLSQTKSVQFIGGQTYTLTGHYRWLGGSGMGVAVRKAGTTNEHGFGFQVLAAGPISASGAFTFTFKPASTFSGRLMFAAAAGSSSGRRGAVISNLGSPAPAGAPEIDAETAAAPLALMLGGLALMSERRRRESAAE